MLPEPILYRSNPTPKAEDILNDQLQTLLDTVIGEITGEIGASKVIEFTAKNIGAVNLVKFLVEVDHREDGLYINGAKFAVDVVMPNLGAAALQVGGAAILTALGVTVGQGPLAVLAVAGGLNLAGKWLWEKVESNLPEGDLVDHLFGTADTEIRYVVNDQIVGGGIYEYVEDIDFVAAMGTIAHYAGATPAGTMKVYKNGNLDTTYAIWQGDAVQELSAGMGVSSAEFYTWNWAKDKDGVATTNGTQLVNYDGQENLTFVAAGATIALKMWSADYTRLEHLSIRADHIGIGRGAVATALEPTVIIGNAADETLDAARSSDTYIIGGKGDDFITGGSGNDRLFGGQLQGDAKSSEINTLSGLDGNDLIVGAGGVDIIDGGKGVDTILGGYGNDRILGGEGEDLIHGDVLFSGKSNLDGIDNLAGGEDRDRIFGEDGADLLVGGDISNFYDVSLRVHHPEWNDGVQDVLSGGFGNDRYLISHENDYTYSKTLAESLELIDIITETSGDGIGEILVQNHKIIQMGGSEWVETTDAIAVAGTYEAVSTDEDGTLYINTSWTTDDLATTQWVVKILVSTILDELGRAFLFLLPEYPDDGAPYAAIKGFMQGHFGITLQGYSSASAGTPNNDTIHGPEGAGLLTAASDVISDADSNEQLHAGAGDDVIYGRGGQDEIQGEEGNDTLYGNENDDLLTGGVGNDTYGYARGEGNDTIIETADNSGSLDRLIFSDIDASEIMLRQKGNDLIIEIAESTSGAGDGGSILVKSSVAGDLEHGIESIQFSDGTIWTKQDIISNISVIEPEGIIGTSGADSLEGSRGDDLIIGLAGDDALSGSFGDDVYVYSSGQGGDVINDGVNMSNEIDVLRLTDLTAADVMVARDGENLTLTIIASGEVITVQKQFLSDGYWGIEKIEFSDGTSWNRETILDIGRDDDAPTVIGTSGNDTLNGTGDNDVFDGGQGNDVLVGARGSDKYLYRLGDGSDLIDEVDWLNDVDTLKLINISSSDVVAVHNGVNLQITITSTGDVITVKDQWYTSWGNAGLESIEFADGTWDREAIMAIEGIPIVGTNGNDTIEGTTDDDNITGGLGDDHLSGRLGSDVYVYSSGDGNDVLDDKGSDIGGVDVLRLTNVNAADIVATRDGLALTLRIISTNALITIEQQYSSRNDPYGFEKIEFADGSSWNRDALMELGRIPNIVGTSGNDTLTGIWFNETISGGLGDDVLMGDYGSDTYVYNSGDGSDRVDDDSYSSSDSDILRLVDINAGDISLARSGLDLKITILATGAIMTIDDQFDPRWYYGLEKIEFADGSYLSRADLMAINESSQTLVGTSAVDFLTSASANDTLEGKQGDDWMNGAAGSDIYIYAAGDGNDNITDREDDRLSDIDVLRLTDLNASDVALVRAGPDLRVRILSTGHEITVWQQFSSQSDFAGIERIEFADGSSWDRSVIMAAESGEITGTSGNDTLNGTSGDDVFNGGLGDDHLYGAGGTDVYLYSSGDGSDYIDDEATEPNSVDTLRFTDINESDISVARNGVNLDITVLATGDVITIDEQWYDENGYWGFEKIEFADGTSWNRSEIMAIGAPPEGPITGTAGDDTLTGTSGADTFIGGLGDDRMLGGQGADVYVYTSGDGTDYIDDEANEPNAVDTLRFTDINASDISATRNGVNLDITVLATGDVITLDEQWYSDAAYWGFEKIEFADGSSWNREVLMNITNAVAPTIGTSGGDTLLGTGGDDVISGLAGDDQLQGGNGSDRMDGGAGSDVAAFEHDLSAYTISVEDGRVLVVNGSFTDTITNVEKLQFSDMSVSVGADGSLTYSGTAGDDTITGTTGDDTIKGSAGDDVLNGLLGDDSLYGGVGGDLLDGLEGNDTYYYAAGDGNDTISDEAIALGDTDVLRFTDLSIGDLTISRTGEDLFITVNATGHVITINTQYYNEAQGWSLETLEFADGTSLALDHLPDTSWIYGTNSAETIDGNWGKDYFFGGQGDDVINGSAGGDVYTYNRGDGSDTLNDYVGFTDALDVLRFNDLNASDLVAARRGDDVEVTVVPTGAVITLKSQLFGDPGYWGIDKFEFADGSSWDRDAITEFGMNAIDKITVVGTSGDDTLYGTSNHDVFDGGVGNDFLLGGYGSDTYLYAAGDGTDYIDDEANAAHQIDVLKFTDLNQSDIVAERDGINLKLTVISTGDTVTLDEQYYADTDYWGFEKIEFADGTVWDRDAIMDIGSPSAMVASASPASASGSDDVLVGTEADDTFIFRGNFGHDTIVDFSAGAGSADVIEIESDIFADFASVIAAAAQSGSDTLITNDGDNSILLKNVALTTLHQDDFRFVAAA
ncbi:calcium-binding protein [Rhizobium leguminosarum]|uniref:calcium-binding protein n=1 Tax=Rhizobium leguminosarum TaxID=384 RepID=UPI001CDBBE62|nr:calcium-binding protein [Rhizobium leguminosarum]MCA2410802.1 RTX toxin [Rhizobium leguminosarum]